ncbi:N-acyl-D-amino-acid deacylase [Actinophytocola oryzae]|uniref:N-acyl-D-amino-acid deacylase n=1 Tax=Actinophytocola oryzae TaxID=502181 RepID=A0A4R7W4Y1_9PSEU|nr:N-acyl-D-amino-acid deacylase [Actinophytocola oryzae]
MTGGLVLDGTGAPGRYATVLVRDGRIASVGEALPSDVRHVDVSGRVVCPGFVDIHTHSDLTLLSDPRALSKVHQGVTTEVVGNCGLGVTAPERADLRAAVSYLDLDPSVAWTWTDLPGYLDTVAEAGPGVNVAALVGHLVLRAVVCGFADRPATPAELDTMGGLLRDALDAGAVGLSTGLVYAPLPFAREDELLALAEVTAAAGKIFTWHVRSYDDGLIESVTQAVTVARRTGCRTQISHLAAVGRRNWGAVRQALDLVDAANADGCSVGVDIYPYLHGNAPLAQLLPAWAQEGGPTTWVPRLADPAVRARIREGWRNRPTTWDEITISWTARPVPALGSTIAELAGGGDGDEVALDLLAELGTGVMMTAGGRSDDDLRTVLAHPSAVVASDGQALDPGGVTGAGVPHPRSYGCFPRYLTRYADDLADAVRRCTSAPAARLGLTDRGVLREGAPADVVVFDPERLGDRATFTDPHRFADGIDLVLVNGAVTVEGGEHTGTRAGHVLRGASC